MPIDPSAILVVIAQGQSRSPEKRELEEQIAAIAGSLPNTTCLLIPHLYDLAASSKSVETLKEWNGPIILLSWLFDRAAFWVLDRFDIRGRRGLVELINPDFVTEEDEESDGIPEEDAKAEDRVINVNPRPARPIYSIDMRASKSIDAFQVELTRIVGLNAQATQPILPIAVVPASPLRVDEHPQRRWYPVIDYSRCTNCMECIDFCLFGVYGVDGAETILVEQPDNCRKGCPACSRVCPENAIIFPQHKTPAIAGAPVDAGGFKIDLSKLFGAPELNEDPIAAAARERDEQLMLAGRTPVGAATAQALPSEPTSVSSTMPLTTDRPRDQFDSLIDQLDQLDL